MNIEYAYLPKLSITVTVGEGDGTGKRKSGWDQCNLIKKNAEMSVIFAIEKSSESVRMQNLEVKQIII